ncbi:Ger(x)C family spore germination protein [Solibacillus sp. A46]|uniref:Ger(X)C family spore germination protein n=1 Tax=Solibacillus faecavium TaxID=2762221 RepID=A0ABR8XWQ0_9BACL|nr:Ger(x)C family spore germination protein [Solibacillus faecavium]
MVTPLFLAGCWDERLYKNSSVVSLTGIEGTIGDLTGYYAYPEATSPEMKTVVITGNGISPRDVRQEAEVKVEQTMDLSVLSTILMSEETAEHNIYEYLDIYFRDANSPITSKLAIVQGELKRFFEITESRQSTTGEYYDRFITSLEENSLVIPYTLQTATSLIFEDAQDLALPYLKMGEDDRPNADGIALFSGRHYTGKTLNTTEAILLNIMNDSLGFSTRITYLFKDSPITVRVDNLKRKLNISENKIEIDLNIDFMVSEFPQDNLDKVSNRKELDKFLTEKIEHDMNEVLKKLQEAKCDALGLGRSVRAFHPQWFKKDWNEHFSNLDISAKVNIEITKTGILE